MRWLQALVFVPGLLAPPGDDRSKVLGNTAPTPTVTATPLPTEIPATPHLIVALETEQGKAGERTALFDDGTLAFVTRWSGRSVLTRKKLSAEEIAVIRQVCLDALPSDEETVRRKTVLIDANVRRMELEIVDDRGTSHRFAFDDFTQISLSLGRARGAVEDLRARFLVKEVPKEQQWDPSSLREGDVLVRRSDSTRFEIVRDDSYEKNLELRRLESATSMLFLAREEVPKIFEEPVVRPKGAKGRM
jgi:hypothetical protein